jgi:hypothetical protein
LESRLLQRNDWLGGLTLVIKNTSAKTVSWVRLDLSFHRERELDVGLIEPCDLRDWTFGYRRSCEAERRRSNRRDRRGFVHGGAISEHPGKLWTTWVYPKSVAKVEVSVEQVSFEGEPDVMWIEGKMNRWDSSSSRAGESDSALNRAAWGFDCNFQLLNSSADNNSFKPDREKRRSARQSTKDAIVVRGTAAIVIQCKNRGCD